MTAPKTRERRIRLRSPETKRLRTYDVDEELDPTLLQLLNDLAFLYGVEIVSTCAGHDTGWDGDEDDVFGMQASFAEIRFSALYPRSLRLEAQRAKLCISILAATVAGDDSVTEVEHDLVIDPEQPRRRPPWPVLPDAAVYDTDLQGPGGSQDVVGTNREAHDACPAGHLQ